VASGFGFWKTWWERSGKSEGRGRKGLGRVYFCTVLKLRRRRKKVRVRQLVRERVREAFAESGGAVGDPGTGTLAAYSCDMHPPMRVQAT
jgi:hypothetical protein